MSLRLFRGRVGTCFRQEGTVFRWKNARSVYSGLYQREVSSCSFSGYMFAPLPSHLATVLRVSVSTIRLIVPTYFMVYGAATLISIGVRANRPSSHNLRMLSSLLRLDYKFGPTPP